MKILLLLFLMIVGTALGAYFSGGFVHTVFLYALFITGGVSAVVLISGASD